MTAKQARWYERKSTPENSLIFHCLPTFHPTHGRLCPHQKGLANPWECWGTFHFILTWWRKKHEVNFHLWVSALLFPSLGEKRWKVASLPGHHVGLQSTAVLERWGAKNHRLAQPSCTGHEPGSISALSPHKMVKRFYLFIWDARSSLCLCVHFHILTVTQMRLPQFTRFQWNIQNN